MKKPKVGDRIYLSGYPKHRYIDVLEVNDDKIKIKRTNLFESDGCPPYVDESEINLEDFVDIYYDPKRCCYQKNNYKTVRIIVNRIGEVDYVQLEGKFVFDENLKRTHFHDEDNIMREFKFNWPAKFNGYNSYRDIYNNIDMIAEKLKSDFIDFIKNDWNSETNSYSEE